MRWLLALAYITAAACNAGPEWVTLPIIVESGSAWRTVRVGGYGLGENVPSAGSGAVVVDRVAGSLVIGSVRPLRLQISTAEYRIPAMQVEIVRLRDHDVIAVGIRRRLRENKWTITVGGKPTFTLPCRRAGDAVRCRR